MTRIEYALALRFHPHYDIPEFDLTGKRAVLSLDLPKRSTGGNRG